MTSSIRTGQRYLVRMVRIQKNINGRKQNMATDFPKKGDDKKISLRNSNYPLFDRNFAASIKEDDPKIWKAGGNIEGNNSYRLLLRAYLFFPL